MENGSDWTASALFSPSKAREQQARAQEWASIDSWLSKKYPSRPLPTFERNEETLQALLSLASLNENMDEQRTYIDRLEKAALQALPKRTSQTSANILPLVLNNLKTDDFLDSLAHSSIELGAEDVKVSSLATCVVDLTTTHFETNQQLDRVAAQRKALEIERERLARYLATLSKDEIQPPPGLPGMISEWQRSTKHLKAKVGEYEERLQTLRSAQSPGPRLEDIMRQEETVRDWRSRLADLSAELQAYEGLPSEPGAARRQMERARDDLRKLVNQRDRMFENLTDSRGMTV